MAKIYNSLLVTAMIALPVVASAQATAALGIAGSSFQPMSSPPVTQAVSGCPNNQTAQAAAQAAANATAIQANSERTVINAAISPGSELMACLDRLAKLSTTLTTPDWGGLLSQIENQLVSEVCSMADSQWQSAMAQVNQAAMMAVPIPGVGNVNVGGAQVTQGAQQGYVPTVNQQAAPPAGATGGVLNYLNNIFR